MSCKLLGFDCWRSTGARQREQQYNIIKLAYTILTRQQFLYDFNVFIRRHSSNMIGQLLYVAFAVLLLHIAYSSTCSSLCLRSSEVYNCIYRYTCFMWDAERSTCKIARAQLKSNCFVNMRSCASGTLWRGLFILLCAHALDPVIELYTLYFIRAARSAGARELVNMHK